MDASKAIELLKEIIAIPSFSKDEDNVATLMEKTWAGYGYLTYRKGNNVWVKSRYYSPNKPTLLFDAHIDTVKSNGTWQTNPYTPVVKNGKLFGLGSNDTGGCIVSMMSAFIQLDKKEQPYNMIYLSSAEEENTGKGGIQSVVDKLGHVDLVLVGEPTSMQAAIAEKGLMVLDCTAKGRSGHAAHNEGINAIYEAMADIEWFKNYSFEKESNLLGAVKMTVTGINAGTLHNVVPASCEFMVDIRINELYRNAEIFQIVESHIKSEVKPRSFSLNSSFIAEDHPVVKRCNELGLNTYGSPTTSNQAVIPWTSMKIGPGDSARSHTANEYIYLYEIKEGIEIFWELLNGLEITKNKSE